MSGEEPKKADSPEEEIESLVPIPKHVVALDGTKVEVPKTTWKDEIQIGRLVSKAMLDVPELGKIAAKTIGLGEMISMLPKVLEVAPGAITSITSILLKKEETWIEDNLDSEIIMELLGPFFGHLFRRVLSKIEIPEVKGLGILELKKAESQK